jgi:hypothetical protein
MELSNGCKVAIHAHVDDPLAQKQTIKLGHKREKAEMIQSQIIDQAVGGIRRVEQAHLRLEPPAEPIEIEGTWLLTG